MDRQATGIAQLLQRVVADAAAVDLEALTVQRGRWSWVLRLDIHVLSHSGNLVDCALLATVACLCAFRLPQTEISSAGAVVVFTPEEREPLPLTVQHVPLSSSFALFSGGEVTILDPTREETAAAEGSITVIATEHGELCGVHKVEGCAMSPDVIQRCVRLCISGIPDVAKTLREALRVHDISRVHSRVRRVGGDGAAAAGSTAAAAEEVRAARERAAPAARGSAAQPRQEVVVLAALPSGELPALEGLDVAQKPAATASQPSGGVVPAQQSVRSADAGHPRQQAGGGRGDAAQQLGPAEVDADDGDEHSGLGVRAPPQQADSGGAGSEGEAGPPASGGQGSVRKKGRASGVKRCSPGVGADGFEELAGRIGNPGGEDEGAPTLAASVRTPRKKARAAGKGKKRSQ